MKNGLIILGVACLAICGCTSHSTVNSDDAVQQQVWLTPVAYLDGQPVRRSDLDEMMIEAAGGRVLAEYVLNQSVQNELLRRGKQLTGDQISQEKIIFLKLLDDNPDIAAQLMTEQRNRQGHDRFDAFIIRQAGLRLLVQDEVEISDLAVRQAYTFQYGPRYEIRLITVNTLADASDVIKRLKDGEQFSDLAAKLSTDPSMAQGGLLSPMSLIDPTYPLSVREAVEKLPVGQVSSPIPIDTGYAVVRLERIVEAVDVDFEDVKPQMVEMVRRQSEQLLMQRRARAMLQAADLQIHHPVLKRSWQQQIDAMFSQ